MASTTKPDEPTKEPPTPEAPKRDEYTPFKFAFNTDLDIDGLPQALPSDITSPIIQLKVGNERHGKYLNLHAHESVLCKVPFFKAALQSSFKESTTKIVKMPEDDSELVTSWVEFLYRGDYNDLGPASANTKQKETTIIDKQLQGQKGGNGLTDVEAKFWQKWYHARMYALGEKYGCERLCKSAGEKISAIPITVDEKTVGLFMEYLLMVYEISGPGSRLRLSTASDCLIKCDARDCVSVIWSAWTDGEGGKHLETAFAKCPDIAVDMMRVFSGSLATLAKDAALPSATGQQWRYSTQGQSGNPSNPYLGKAKTTF